MKKLCPHCQQPFTPAGKGSHKVQYCPKPECQAAKYDAWVEHNRTINRENGRKKKVAKKAGHGPYQRRNEKQEEPQFTCLGCGDLFSTQKNIRICPTCKKRDEYNEIDYGAHDVRYV